MKKQVRTYLIVATFLLIISPASTSAAVSVQYQTAAQQQQIAYLYSVIAQLQAQLATLQPSATYYTAPSPYSYLSSVTNTSNYITVETGGVTSGGNNYVTLEGTISFRQNSAARVWFEYGTNYNLQSSSYSLDISRSYSRTSYSFSLPTIELSSNTTYYYRAVAEDEHGRVVEGTIRSFVTENHYNYSYNYHNSYDCSNNDFRCWSDYNDYNYNNDYILDVSNRTYYRGDDVTVSYEIPYDEHDSNNWIGLYRIGDSNSNYRSKKSLNRNTSGDIDFTINSTGDYELRLFVDSNSHEVATSREFTVRN